MLLVISSPFSQLDFQQFIPLSMEKTQFLAMLHVVLFRRRQAFGPEVASYRRVFDFTFF